MFFCREIFANICVKIPFCFFDLSQSVNDLICYLLHTELRRVPIYLVNLGNFYAAVAVFLASILKTVCNFCLKSVVDYKRYLLFAYFSLKPRRKMCDSREHVVKVLFLNLCTGYLAERRVAPAVVRAAKDDNGVNLVVFKETLGKQLFKSVYERRGARVVGIAVARVSYG